MQAIKNFRDSEIVANIRAGQDMDGSIKAIYGGCFDSLTRYVMNNTGNRQDAEDIFQEAVVNFIDMVQKNRFREESSIKTFLFSLNRHLWLNELKRRGRSLVREQKYDELRDKSEQDISHELVDKEAGSQLSRLVELLGDTCKKILLLFYYENLSIREILDTLHYENEQVVRNKKYKCLKQLEQMVNDNPAVKQTLQNLLHG